MLAEPQVAADVSKIFSKKVTDNCSKMLPKNYG
jgi:hypothetical protein